MNTFQKAIVYLSSTIKYKRACLIERGAIVYGDCFFEGKNKISTGAHVTYSKLGYATYIGKNSTFSHAEFGRFCAIGENVKLIRAKHPIDTFVSIHPAFYSTKTLSSFVRENKYDDIIHNNEGVSLIVGNDVWIGNGALLKGGISIGDGSVIAMGAVVTKDIPPYSIVGGIPAKVIGYRFSETERAALLKSKWWEKDIDWIRENAEYFSEVEKLLKIIGE